MFKLLAAALGSPFLNETASVGDIVTVAGSVITGVIGWLTQFSTWLLSDPIGQIGLAMMFIMLGVKLYKLFTKGV